MSMIQKALFAATEVLSILLIKNLHIILVLKERSKDSQDISDISHLTSLTLTQPLSM